MAKLSSLVRKENVKIENNEREIAMGEDRLHAHVKVVGLVADVFCTTKIPSTATDMSSLSVQF